MSKADVGGARATGPEPPTRLPQWWEPLRSRAVTAVRSDFTRLPTPTDRGRRSAVLILLGEQAGEPDVLVVQRTAHLRAHAGEVAFPGGGVEPGDADPAATALREAHEEAAVAPDSVTVVAQLPQLFIPVSDFVVTPVLAWWHRPHLVYPRDRGEVSRVVRIPIAALADPANRLRVRAPSGYQGPAFQIGDLLVWGFTAGVLSTLLELGGWARPWPVERVVELPRERARPVP